MFPGAVKSYPTVAVGGVAESARSALYLLDEPVDAFGTGVGDAGIDEGFDGGPPGFNGGGEGTQLVNVGGGAPVVEGAAPVGSGYLDPWFRVGPRAAGSRFNPR